MHKNQIDVLSAILQRASTRAFLNKPVNKSIITAILNTAKQAPSGVNAQPWRVIVLQGEKKQALSQAIIAARKAGQPENPDYHYYPTDWFEPYKTRRKECGIALYKALDIKREDLAKRAEVWERNYDFFGAPVGLIFYIDKRLSKGAWLDTGMFLQNIMLAALAFELATCPQASLAEYPDIVREQLAIPEQFHIVCGMSLGYPDKQAVVNNYRTTRETIDNFVQWLD